LPLRWRERPVLSSPIIDWRAPERHWWWSKLPKRSCPSPNCLRPSIRSTQGSHLLRHML